MGKLYLENEKSTFRYWFAHWRAYNKTARKLHAWRFKYLFHDIEKPFLKLFYPYIVVRGFHRRNNNHHPEWLEQKVYELFVESKYNRSAKDLLDSFDYKGMVIDWECSRYTKKDSPLNAFGEFQVLKEKMKNGKYPYIYAYCWPQFLLRIELALFDLGLYGASLPEMVDVYEKGFKNMKKDETL